MKVKVNNTWKDGIPHVRVGGRWKKAIAEWVKVGGKWKKVAYLPSWYVNSESQDGAYVKGGSSTVDTYTVSPHRVTTVESNEGATKIFINVGHDWRQGVYYAEIVFIGGPDNYPNNGQAAQLTLDAFKRGEFYISWDGTDDGRNIRYSTLGSAWKEQPYNFGAPYGGSILRYESTHALEAGKIFDAVKNNYEDGNGVQWFITEKI